MASPSSAETYEVDLRRLRSWFGIGVAGNFAGHLEQAGEAGDFVNVDAAASAPKGLFPFYAPGLDSFLSVFPLSHDEIALPNDADAAATLQAEPEVGLACTVEYANDGTVEEIVPFAFGACNDCSIRRPGAAKISEKKNWGACSKGVAPRFIGLDGANLEQATATHRLACFLRRDGELHRYGVDSDRRDALHPVRSVGLPAGRRRVDRRRLRLGATRSRSGSGHIGRKPDQGPRGGIGPCPAGSMRYAAPPATAP